MENENKIIPIALQLAGYKTELLPETIIYGYVRLLLIDENTIRNLVLYENSIDDIEKIRFYFESKNIDLKLAQIGLKMCIPYLSSLINEIPFKSVKEAYTHFEHFFELHRNSISSLDLITMSISASITPVLELFTKGNTMEQVYSFLDSLKRGEVEYKKEVGNVETVHLEGDNNENKVDSDKCDDDKNKEEINENSFVILAEKYNRITVELLEKVKGQDAAVMKFVEGCYQGELLFGEEETNKPKSSFFFFGPPGVGKTFLAESAAKAMGIPSKMFNMAEYTRNEDKDDLVGVSDFYKSAREGVLVEFVEKNPNCILIFDEIEKAAQNVIRIFLQMLASGKVYNVFQKKDTDFSNAIIVFTSNAGRSLYENSEENLSSIPESVLVNALMNEKDRQGNSVFPSEICSRIATGTTIIFNHIKIRTLNKMVENQFEKTIIAIEKKYGYKVSYTEELSKLFLFSQGSALDARIATVQGPNFFKREIYELSKQLHLYEDDSIDSINFVLDTQGIHDDIERLFKNKGNTSFLIFAGKEIAKLFPQNDSFVLYNAVSLDSARDILKEDISAVFIDPTMGMMNDRVQPLSITDYETEGVRLFHELVENQSGMPVYILGNSVIFSEIDRNTFLQEGAYDIVEITVEHMESFNRKIEQISEEVYMERQRNEFCQRGWVIDYRTKQERINNKQASIVFYDLKKKKAIDSDSRNDVLKETERPSVKFNDVIGAENAKEELKYYIDFLKNPRQFLSSGGRMPKGVILYGPPGTGKTMLAKAMAGESDVTFLQTSASGFKNKYIGESEANIRRVFVTAKKYAPSIIFIDEIDAIGKKRTGSEGTSHTESMLNALLTEMDGFTSENNIKRPVFVLAATNFGIGDKTEGISLLDEALIRRFDRQIYVDLPTKDERIQYIKTILSKKKIEDIPIEIIDNLADRTSGQSLAVLQNIMEIPFKKAVMEKRKTKAEDLLQALEEYMYGEKQDHSADFYWEVAIHEAGHAVISFISGDAPSYLTIESRGHFGGYMQHGNQESVSKYTRDDLIGKIRTSFAGRAAEEVFFGKDKSLNTGAASDLENASQLAIQMICTYGMFENQYIVLSKKEILNSPLAENYTKQINELLSREMDETIKIVRENKAMIELVAQELMKKNHLTGDEFLKIVGEC